MLPATYVTVQLGERQYRAWLPDLETAWLALADTEPAGRKSRASLAVETLEAAGWEHRKAMRYVIMAANWTPED